VSRLMRDPSGDRRPHFIATLRAGASWKCARRFSIFGTIRSVNHNCKVSALVKQCGLHESDLSAEAPFILRNPDAMTTAQSSRQ
jgi:hypothetical protein